MNKVEYKDLPFLDRNLPCIIMVICMILSAALGVISVGVVVVYSGSTPIGLLALFFIIAVCALPWSEYGFWFGDEPDKQWIEPQIQKVNEGQLLFEDFKHELRKQTWGAIKAAFCLIALPAFISCGLVDFFCLIGSM